MLVLSQPDIEEILDMQSCIELMGGALTALETGEATQPLRYSYVPAGGQGRRLNWMPVHRSGDHAAFGTKLLCLVPDNPTRRLDSHQGIVVVFDAVTGEPTAILNASAVTAIRTAAVSALATRLLAREQTRVMTIIGAGVQALWHLRSIPLVRSVERAIVVGRSLDRARRFVDLHRPSAAMELVATDDAEGAVTSADVVVTATSAGGPVVFRNWLRPGMHLNLVGASSPERYELEPEALADVHLFTDRRESLMEEAGEYREALRTGTIGASQTHGELGELLTGRAIGRRSEQEVTVFRSLGLAVEDLYSAQFVIEAAHKLGKGTVVAF